MLPEAFYTTDVDLFVPTQATAGPWSPDAQHAGPPAALLSRAIVGASGIAQAQTARITMDILRPIPLVPLSISTQVLRGGKRVELIEAVLRVARDGTELMRARAWRLLDDAVELPDHIPAPDLPPPGPDGFRDGPRPSFWKGDVCYWDALEWRVVAGDFEIPGPATYWSRLRIPLLAGEPTTPLQHALILGDAASGVSSTLDFAAYNFANVDYSLVLERPPAGEWLAMDAITRPGPRGAGACTAVLADADGRFGSSSQTLVVARRA